MNSICLIKLGITKIAVQTSSHTPTQQNSIYRASPGRPARPRREDPPGPAVPGAGGGGRGAGGRRRRGGRAGRESGGSLRTVRVKAPKEPATGPTHHSDTGPQANKTPRPQAQKAGYAAKNRRPAAIVARGRRPPRAPPARAPARPARARSLGTTQGGCVWS